MSKNPKDLFEIALGRTPNVPFPQEDAPVGAWNDYVRDLERQDPEAFELLVALFNSGIRSQVREQEMTGEQK